VVWASQAWSWGPNSTLEIPKLLHSFTPNSELFIERFQVPWKMAAASVTLGKCQHLLKVSFTIINTNYQYNGALSRFSYLSFLDSGK